MNSKLRIGVLTFHNGPNFGGLLQAWHMVHAIRNLGYDCHAVNYLHPTHHRAAQVKIPLRNFNTLRARVYWELKKHGFRGFSESICRHTFTSNVNAVPWDDFDGFCVGSDVVWDYQNPGFGRDPVYFGQAPGLSAKPIMSYAASCGPAVPDGPLAAYVKSGLHRFTALGVRDTATARLVSNATGRESTMVVDPTWLGPDPEPEWKQMPQKKYLFLYGAKKVDRATGDIIRRYCRDHRLELVSALTSFKGADKMYRSLTPFQWADLFRNAECTVVLGTLHGTVYSIKYGKPFILITSAGTTQKITSILEQTNQSHRLLREEEFSSDSLSLLDPDVHESPSIPKNWRDKSLRFLDHALAVMKPEAI